MKKIAVLIAILLVFQLGFSQRYEHDASIELEVNEQVWKPFKQAFEDRDWERFNALHTDDVMRISTWSGIRIGEEYKNTIKESYQRVTQRKTFIDFRMEHRIYDEKVGFEVGYYRIIYEEPGKDRQFSYARFQVVLKKVEGVWKIAQDWDIDMINGVKVTKADFEKGPPLNLD